MTPAEALELARITRELDTATDDHLAFAVDMDGDLPPIEDVAEIMAELDRQAKERSR